MDDFTLSKTPGEPNRGLHPLDNENNLVTRKRLQSSSTLAFVALWDPDNGIIVFSSVDIKDGRETSETNTTNRVHFPKSSVSVSDVESVSFYQPALSLGGSAHSSEYYDALQSRHNTLFSGDSIPDLHRRRGASQTSSTLGGLDVYLKGAALSTTHRHQPVYSFLNLNTDFQFPDNPDGPGVATGFTLGSTLDIERYLKNGPMDKQGDSWSRVDSSRTTEHPVETPNSKSRSGRRLQKKRKCAPTDTGLNVDTVQSSQRQVFHPWKLLRTLVCMQKSTCDNCDWVVIDAVEAV